MKPLTKTPCRRFLFRPDHFRVDFYVYKQLSPLLVILLAIGGNFSDGAPAMEQRYGNGKMDDLPPLIKGYDEFEMKALDGFQVSYCSCCCCCCYVWIWLSIKVDSFSEIFSPQGVSMELNFLDGELNYEVTRDNYALINDDIIKV